MGTPAPLPDPAPTAGSGRPKSSPSAGRVEGLGTFWRILRANPLSLIGFVLVAFLVIVALVGTVAPRVVAPYGPTESTGIFNQGPSAAHPFGTDGNSFDIYSNVVLAVPLDLGIGLVIAGSALLLGGGLGLIAGYWDRPRTVGGAVATIILRVTDIFLSFPSLILALAIGVSLGRGVWQAILAVAITWWPYYVRLVRGEVLAIKHLPYITAARAAGVRDGRIVLRHVLRNVLDPVLVYFTLDIGTILVTFSTIGFVAHPIPYPGPTPEWGSMMSYYSAALVTVHPWTILAPGAAIFVTVLAFSLLGDGLRDVLDPRSRRALVRSKAPTPPKETPASPGGVAVEPGDSAPG
ncbi:MAG TPA: ABC transporter permease [Thermoplasmata archaeon]